MKKMKLTLIIFIIFLLFSGCSAKKTSAPVVCASFYPMYLITEKIVSGTDIDLENTASPQTGCLHDYQLTAGNIRLLNKSDVLVINGGGMEDSFIEKAAENSDIKIIDSSEYILSDEQEEHEEEHNHDHGENVHYWMDIHYVILQAEAIADELAEIYPQYGDIFEKNYAVFAADCEKLESEFDFSVYDTVNVVSFHEAFEFLCEDSNINILKTIEIDENFTPSAREIAQTIDEAREKGISAVICANDSGLSYAKSVAKELEVPFVVLNPITYTDKGTLSYIDAMRSNMNLIKEIFEND